MTDRAILELLNRRDEKGLTAVQEQYSGYCYTVAYNILGSREDAEECVNDMLIRLWNAIPLHSRKMSAHTRRRRRKISPETAMYPAWHSAAAVRRSIFRWKSWSFCRRRRIMWNRKWTAVSLAAV